MKLAGRLLLLSAIVATPATACRFDGAEHYYSPFAAFSTPPQPGASEPSSGSDAQATPVPSPAPADRQATGNGQADTASAPGDPR